VSPPIAPVSDLVSTVAAVVASYSLLLAVEGTGDMQRRDIAGQDERLDDNVVTRVSASERHTGRRDELAAANTLGAERCGVARRVDRDVVSTDDADQAGAREVHRGRSRTVVDLVVGGRAGHGEARRSDVRSQIDRLDGDIVARIRPASVTRPVTVTGFPDPTSFVSKSAV